MFHPRVRFMNRRATTMVTVELEKFTSSGAGAEQPSEIPFNVPKLSFFVCFSENFLSAELKELHRRFPFGILL